MNSISKLTLASHPSCSRRATLPGRSVGAQSAPQAAAAPLPDIGERKTITEADCTAAKLGTAIPVGAIGEPVSSVTLGEPRWTAAADTAPAYCTVDGAMAPVDPAAKPINFRVVFPASWTLRAAQLGGGGMNGIIPEPHRRRVADRSGRRRAIVTYGSDSGHGVEGCAGMGAQRRSDQEPRLHADEEDARRRDGDHRARCTASSRASTTTSAPRRADAKR